MSNNNPKIENFLSDEIYNDFTDEKGNYIIGKHVGNDLFLWKNNKRKTFYKIIDNYFLQNGGNDIDSEEGGETTEEEVEYEEEGVDDEGEQTEMEVTVEQVMYQDKLVGAKDNDNGTYDIYSFDNDELIQDSVDKSELTFFKSDEEGTDEQEVEYEEEVDDEGDQEEMEVTVEQVMYQDKLVGAKDNENGTYDIYSFDNDELIQDSVDKSKLTFFKSDEDEVEEEDENKGVEEGVLKGKDKSQDEEELDMQTKLQDKETLPTYDSRDLYFANERKTSGYHDFYKRYLEPFPHHVNSESYSEPFKKCLNRIEVNEWIMPEISGFNNFIRDVFTVKIEEYIKKNDKESERDKHSQLSPYYEENIQNQQLFVQNYLQENSPYRGLLVYHGLGSGKTATSILAAESTNHRKIFCFLPASLDQNYKLDLSRWGDISYRSRCRWRFLKKTKKFTDKKFNKLLNNLGIPHGSWSEITKFDHNNLDELGYNLDNDDIRKIRTENSTKNDEGIWYVDEDNGFEYDSLSLYDRFRINYMISKLIDNKYILPHYNGNSSCIKIIFKNSLGELYESKCIELGINKPSNLKRKDCVTLITAVYNGEIENPLNNSFIVIDEVHNLVSRILGGGSYGPMLYYLICNSINTKILAMSGTPIVNNPYEISVLINMIKGYEKIYKLGITSIGQLHEEDIMKIGNEQNQIRSIKINAKNILITRLPLGFNKSDKKGSIMHFSNVPNIDITNSYETNTCNDEEFIDKIIEIFTNEEKPFFNKNPDLKENINIVPCFPDRLTGLQTSDNKLMIDNPNILSRSLEIAHKTFIEKYIDEDNNINADSIEDLKNRIRGYISFYNEHPDGFAEKIFDPEEPCFVEMSNYQLFEYNHVRDIEREKEGKKKKKVSLDMANISDIEDKSSDFFKVFSRQALLFVWPPNVKRPRKADYYSQSSNKNIEYFTNENSFLSNDYLLNEFLYKGNIYKSVRDALVKLEDESLLEDLLEKKFRMKELKTKLLSTLTLNINDKSELPQNTNELILNIRETLNNEAKKEADIINTQKQNYSELLSLAGEDSINTDNFNENRQKIIEAIASETSKTKEEAEKILDNYIASINNDDDIDINDVFENIDIDKLYNEELKKQIDKLTDTNLSPIAYNKFYNENKTEWRDVDINNKFQLNELSPKMCEAVENIDNSEGPTFIYSQFRTAEGVGVFSKCLESCGYTFRDFYSNNYSKELKEGKAVRYKENETLWKTGRIISIDGGTVKLYPGSISDTKAEIIEKKINEVKLAYFAYWSGDVKQTTRHEIQKTFNQSTDDPNTDNKWGQNIMAILATSAGAEGINLHFVRQVHILEPYWNNVRIDQVIGRSRRFYSHEKLPEEQRNVKVYYYISKFSEKQTGQDTTSLENLDEYDEADRLTLYNIYSGDEGNLSVPTTNDFNKLKASLLSCLAADAGLTSDQFLHTTSIKKTKITNQILDIMKESAIDCNFNLEINQSTKGFDSTLTCYTDDKLPDGSEIYNIGSNKLETTEFKGYEQKILYQEFKIKTGVIKTYMSFNVSLDDKDKPITELLQFAKVINMYDFFSVNKISPNTVGETFTERSNAIKYIIDNINQHNKIGIVKIDNGQIVPKWENMALIKNNIILSKPPPPGIITESIDNSIKSEYNPNAEYDGAWRKQLNVILTGKKMTQTTELNKQLSVKSNISVISQPQSEPNTGPESEPQSEPTKISARDKLRAKLKKKK